MKIICMGDSLTYGAGLVDLSQRWSDLVANKTGHTIINMGINGDTTAGMLVRCHQDVFPQKPDLMIIMGGTNDLCFTWEYRQATSNLTTIILHARAHDIPVLVGIPTPIDPEVLPVREWNNDRDNQYIAAQCEKYADWIRRYCHSSNIPIVDFRKAFFSSNGTLLTHYFSDGLHPNSLGHQAMAEVLCQTLQTLYNGNLVNNTGNTNLTNGT